MNDWETVGHVGVDSGTLWIGDPCYAVTGDRYRPKEDLVDLISGSADAYGPGAVFEEHPELKASVGMIIGGFGGDGIFPVKVKRDDRGLICEIKIDVSDNLWLKAVYKESQKA